MNFWYQHALVNIWKKCRASTLAFKTDRFLRFFVFSLHSSFWRVDSPSVHTYAALCWCWKRICHNRRYSMSLAFKRPLYNVLTCLGRHDWRLFQSAIWAIFRPLRNSWFRWLACLILEDLLLDPPCWTAASICNIHVNIGNMSNAEMRHAAVTWKNSRPARGLLQFEEAPRTKWKFHESFYLYLLHASIFLSMVVGNQPCHHFNGPIPRMAAWFSVG